MNWVKNTTTISDYAQWSLDTHLGVMSVTESSQPGHEWRTWGTGSDPLGECDSIEDGKAKAEAYLRNAYRELGELLGNVPVTIDITEGLGNWVDSANPSPHISARVSDAEQQELQKHRDHQNSQVLHRFGIQIIIRRIHGKVLKISSVFVGTERGAAYAAAALGRSGLNIQVKSHNVNEGILIDEMANMGLIVRKTPESDYEIGSRLEEVLDRQRDLNNLKTLASKGFITCESDGMAGRYEVVAKFRSLLEAQDFYTAIIGLASIVQREAP